MQKYLILAIFLPQVLSVIYHDPLNEAVVIDDTIIYDPSEFEPPEEGDVTTQRPDGYCTTTGGTLGTCVPLRDCYPYADEISKSEKDSGGILYGFLSEVINSTQRCTASGESLENLVCCPSFSYQILPAKKPGFLPQFPIPTGTPTTTEGTTTSTTPSTNVTTPTTNITEAGEHKKKRNCGTYIKSTDDLVVGGHVAGKGEFPWVVAITNRGNQFCGGSLINPSFILTAAHCVQSLRDGSTIQVLLGGHNLGASEAGRVSRGVTKILYHRDFSMQHLRNDIALLKLSTPVTYSTSIQPVCLNTEDNLTYKEQVRLAGWGKTCNSCGTSKVLRTVKMSLISPSKCTKTYQGTQAPGITQGMICAGERSSLKDACNGDSGSSLTLGDDGTAKQIGVVSWGIGCGEKPGVYTKVSNYIPWITKNSK